MEIAEGSGHGELHDSRIGENESNILGARRVRVGTFGNRFRIHGAHTPERQGGMNYVVMLASSLLVLSCSYGGFRAGAGGQPTFLNAHASMTVGVLMRSLCLAILILSAVAAEAQPTLPRDRVPTVPQALRGFVDRLYSADPAERAD